MNLHEALSGLRRVCIDSTPLIYFVEQNPIYIDRVRTVLVQIDSGNIEAVSSMIALTEVLTHPIRLKKMALENAYRQIMQHSQHFALLSVDESVAVRAADLRARYNFRTPDALHLATAIESHCDAFLTNDRDLKRISEIRVLVLDDLELDEPESKEAQ